MVYTNQLEHQVVRNLDRIILNIDQIVKRAHWTIVEEGGTIIILGTVIT